MKISNTYSWLEISAGALRHNISAHRRLLPKKTKLMAVIKSNAYGHGLEQVVKVCEGSRPVDWYGVAYLDEAFKLRMLAKKTPILILSHYLPYNRALLAKAIKSHISFVVYEIGQIKALERASRAADSPARLHLKLETGMARLGQFPEPAAKLLQLISKSKYLKLEGVASHFSTAEEANGFVKYQLQVLKDFIADNKKYISKKVLQHISCTASILTAPDTHLDMVRLGIGLYGLWPSAETHKKSKAGLAPVLAWKTTIIEIQKLPKGIVVGYGKSFITNKSIVMASIPVGYWEGYDRRLGNKGVVLIGGKRCPIIGRICMNLSMVDVSKVKGVKVGDEVVLIGRQGKAEVTADEMAKKIDSINYEVVTCINPQLPRILVK